jgi:hypothetical protein
MTILVGIVYTAVAVAAVYVLRTMARRFRNREDAEVDVPYGPRPPASADERRDDPVGAP